MPTVSQVADSLGVSRDQLHYLIKVARQNGDLNPKKIGKRFLLTPTEVEYLHHTLQEKTKPWGAIMTLKIPGLKTEDAVRKLKEQFREVVWAAGAWGDMSVIALLEAVRFENMASVPFKVREQLPYVNDSRTYVLPSEQYTVKQARVKEKPRLSVILINLVKSSDQEKPTDRSISRVVLELGEIDDVRRYGAIFGPWDCFAEVRHKDSEELYEIVTQQIYGIRGVLDTTTILTMSKVRREGESALFLWG